MFPPHRRPVWLLDVDGVLNAARPGWGEQPAQGTAYVDGVAYLLRWAPSLVRRIASTHAAGGAEVRWCSTWVDHVAQLERLLHLPRIGTAFTGVDPDSRDARGLKIEAALHVVEVERRPLIWTDDDAVPLGGSLHERLEASGQPVILVRPHPVYGLQPEDVAAIEEFIAEEASRSLAATELAG